MSVKGTKKVGQKFGDTENSSYLCTAKQNKKSNNLKLKNYVSKHQFTGT